MKEDLVEEAKNILENFIKNDQVAKVEPEWLICLPEMKLEGDYSIDRINNDGNGFGSTGK